MSTSEVIDAVIDALYGVSDEGTGINVVGNGLWSQVSARFAADTKGDAYSLCSNARSDRIFARDELKQLLNAVPRKVYFFGYSAFPSRFYKWPQFGGEIGIITYTHNHSPSLQYCP